MEMTPFLKFRHCVEIMGRGTIVMEMTLHNVFVKPDELSPSLLEGSAMAITDDKPRGEAEFTQTIPRREGRRRRQNEGKAKPLCSVGVQDYPYAYRALSASDDSRARDTTLPSSCHMLILHH